MDTINILNSLRGRNTYMGGINLSENLSDKKKIGKDKKKNKKKLKIVLITIAVVIIALLGSLYAFYSHIRNQMYSEYTPGAKSSVSYDEVDGITNVLLVGTDARDKEEAARADSIFIATLDNNNKVIKLTNIMRDVLVDIPGYGEYKINEAFANGSAELGEDGEIKGYEGGTALLMETIEENFNLHLDKYVIVNFWGFESIIDSVGGIEVEIKDYELDEVNKYIGEATGLNSPLLTEIGLQTLNGQQALSYARIRNVGDNNFERGDRQSTVLFKLAEKLKEVNPIKYLSIANTISKQVKTNIDIPEALNLAYTIYKFPTLEVEYLQIPKKELIAIDDIYQDKGWCLIIDLEQCSQIMYDFIYNNKTPNSEEFDLVSVQNVAAKYNSQNVGYENTYEEYNDYYYEEESTQYEQPIYNQQKPSETTTDKKEEESTTTDKPDASQDVTPPTTGESGEVGNTSGESGSTSDETDTGSGSGTGETNSESEEAEGTTGEDTNIQENTQSSGENSNP